MRKWILGHEYQALRQSPRPVRPANFPTGFDHDMKIRGWEKDETGVACDDCIEGEESDLSRLVEGNIADAVQAS